MEIDTRLLWLDSLSCRCRNAQTVGQTVLDMIKSDASLTCDGIERRLRELKCSKVYLLAVERRLAPPNVSIFEPHQRFEPTHYLWVEIMGEAYMKKRCKTFHIDDPESNLANLGTTGFLGV